MYERCWDAARRQHGDTVGTGVLIEVLPAHSAMLAAALNAAMAAAVSSGVLDPQVIVIEARAGDMLYLTVTTAEAA